MKMIEEVNLVFLITYAIVYSSRDSIINNYLKKACAYNISNNVSLILSLKGGKDLKYTFFLNGKLHTGQTSLSMHTNGTKYLFYPPYPTKNKATEIIANSEDVKGLPSNDYKKQLHE